MLPSPFPGYLTIAQASERSGISHPHLALLCRNGELDCIKPTPRLWLIQITSLDTYNEKIAEMETAGHLRGRPRGKRTNKKAPR